MSSEEWLAEAVERALSVGDPARYPELVGAVEALAATEAVSAEMAQQMRERLDEAFAPRARGSHPFGDPLAPRAPGASTLDAPAREELIVALSPAAALTEGGGLEVILLAVELWTSVVIVRLANVGATPRADGAAGATTMAWDTGTPGPLPAGVPYASLPNMALLQLPLSLNDDIDTLYTTTHGMAAGDPPLRAERVFAPAVPASARRLTVSVPAHDGHHAGCVEVDLPK